MAARRKRKQTGRRPKKKLVPRILVVAEGTETEPQYIERLSSYLGPDGAFAVVTKAYGVGKDPLEVVRKCVELRDNAARRGKPYDKCVCLVDRDQHTTLESALERAASENILVIVSNLKFEVWLRWHVTASRSNLSSAQLDAAMIENQLLEGKRLSPKFPISNVAKACEHAYSADPKLAAGRVGPNPSSAMPVLIQMMKSG